MTKVTRNLSLRSFIPITYGAKVQRLKKYPKIILILQNIEEQTVPREIERRRFFWQTSTGLFIDKLVCLVVLLMQ